MTSAPGTADHSIWTRVVGIGASAGGLAALEQFFSHVPVDSGLAYVVVQHMDPHHKALLCDLLQRVTPMPVHQAIEGTVVEPNTIYVIPPGHELRVEQGNLRVRPSSLSRTRRLPVDALFLSLADEQRSRAIGVVLSGMGSDGTLGLQEISRQGGATFAQSPSSAQFDAMPQSAISSGCVGVVDLPSHLPARILDAILEQPTPVSPEPALLPADTTSPMESILQLLREHCKHDLSLYKSSTLQRRIDRRVGVHNLQSLQDYLALLRENPRELDFLFAEILIGVTSFFRDAQVWRDLKEQILPELLRPHQHQPNMLRAWIVGCSTGEEAYSLAMVFREVQQITPGAESHGLQIFATDLNADAIATARKGWYSYKAVEGVDPERRSVFFVEQDGGFQIAKSIRDMVLFAQHDVILDPPFTKLDLLSCRNVLIYFKAELQHRLMPLFHFSLRSQGVLLLGGSETAGRSQTLFTPSGLKSRLYRRNDHAPSAVDFPIHPRAMLRKTEQETSVPEPSTTPGNLQTLAEQLLLQTFSPPAVLVNPEGDILYISGRTGRYLEPAAGKANWNIHVMARPGIRTKLAVSLRQALHDQTTIELTGLLLDEDPSRILNITVQPVKEPRALEGMVMVVFREVVPNRGFKSAKSRKNVATAAAMAQDLERAHEEIRALRFEMRASQEELRAANEALQSANEELQSANEELTTSKEEAQSMNEELQTINGELQAKLDDLSLAQSDMQNLLNSTDIATLFLDNDLNVRRFTDRAAGIFHLREGDVGRPLSDLASTLDYPELDEDVQGTLRTLASLTRQVAASDGRWFSVRIMPYRTFTNMIQGAVLTFVDITKAKELEFKLREGYSQS